MISLYGKENAPPPWQILTIANSVKEGNMHFVQKVFDGAFEVSVKLHALLREELKLIGLQFDIIFSSASAPEMVTCKLVPTTSTRNGLLTTISQCHLKGYQVRNGILLASIFEGIDTQSTFQQGQIPSFRPLHVFEFDWRDRLLLWRCSCRSVICSRIRRGERGVLARDGGSPTETRRGQAGRSGGAVHQHTLQAFLSKRIPLG